MCGRHATACALVLGAVVSADIDVPSNVWRSVAVSFVAAGHASQDRTVWDGVYTEAQAKRGEEAYKRSCGYCHRDDLAGGFFDDGTGPANIVLEPNTKITENQIDALGDDFETTKNGFIDFLLLDNEGRPLIVLEAKSEGKNPLAAKEQARRYAREQNARFVILSNGNIH